MAGYKPKTVGGFESIQGVGSLQISKDGRAIRIILDDNPDRGYVISRDNAPKTLVGGKGMYITLSKDGKKLYKAHPNNGMFRVKVKKFSSQQDKPPAPKTNTTWDYQYFVVTLEIIEGPFKGIELPLVLRYNFGSVEEGEKTVVCFTHPKSKYTPLLQDFCEVNGVWERGPMAYSDNILPTLEKRVLRAASEFDIIYKDGFAVNIMTTSKPITEDDDEDDAPFDTDAPTVTHEDDDEEEHLQWDVEE